MNDRLEVQLLGGENREPMTQIKAHLVTKYTHSAGASAIFF